MALRTNASLTAVAQSAVNRALRAYKPFHREVTCDKSSWSARDYDDHRARMELLHTHLRDLIALAAHLCRHTGVAFPAQLDQLR